MNRNNTWRFVIVILLLVWAFFQINPPLGRDLGQVFVENAVDARKDATFTNIVQKYEELQKKEPQRAFANLIDAVDTNDIVRYFPTFEEQVKTDPNPSRTILYRLQKRSVGKIKLGLDLQGGTSFLVGVKTNYLAGDTNALMTQDKQQQALSQAVEVLRKRVDKLGVAEPLIQPQGNDRILVQLPGLSEQDVNAARANIQRAAFLELRMVDDAIVPQGIIPPNDQLMQEKTTGLNGSVSYTNVLVKRRSELTGNHIKNAMLQRDNVGRPEVIFSLDSEGTEIFGKLTRDNVGKRMAIILDGELQSAPVIKEPIENGSCRISGNYTDEEARTLSMVLQNPLQVPLEILAERGVDPTLGRDTVKSGVTSAIVGTAAVAGFMLIYYMLAGAVADIALITNIIILLGVMCSFGSTFTLPGIAGVVLTIGMAVDANVLIFERIREESGKGKSLRGALAAGYDRAFGTIFDSHVTTLISSIVLIVMGTGPIKGFGVTLTIGVAASLFTALVVTRLIFDFLISKGWIKELKMLHIIRATKLDFMKIAKPAFAVTCTIIIIGLSYGYFVRGSKMFGTEFAGGDELTMSFAQKVDQGKLTEAIARETGIKEPTIQYQKEFSTGTELLRITSPIGTGSNVLSVVQKDFPDAGFKRAGLDQVGPTIGEEIRRTAWLAAFWSLLFILLYVAVRYEFSFACGAVLAVVHDVAMTIGCYCLTGLFGAEHARQFNATTVAAILTIIGFSINDTIVIFDRIREDLKLGVRGSFKDIINQALNQTLSRTIITSGTVFIATVSLYVFGGGAINDFAFTFLVGIITGTYSSIYIASALVLWWQNWRHNGMRPRMGSSQVSVQTVSAEARPAAH